MQGVLFLVVFLDEPRLAEALGYLQLGDTLLGLERLLIVQDASPRINQEEPMATRIRNPDIASVFAGLRP
jgi:hypothetical protein